VPGVEGTWKTPVPKTLEKVGIRKNAAHKESSQEKLMSKSRV
jgi:hypothetical protein